jgi:hypothetical protein
MLKIHPRPSFPCLRAGGNTIAYTANAGNVGCAMSPSKAEIFFPKSIVRRLQEERSAATLNRLATSRHVADLRLIVSATGYIFVLCLVLAVIATILDGTASGVSAFIGGMFALAYGIVGWAYQSGNSRLGIVDLFACEITTICRVCTIVDLTRRHVEAFNADLPKSGETQASPDEIVKRIRNAFSHYEASESYTPVFDHNASDLRVLEVKVVTNVTAFYTYLKAMRDALRNLTKVDAPPAFGEKHDAWHEALASVLYMQFLAFESARKAVRDLVEFEPNQVENMITILISELCAYSFLLNYFPAGDATGKGEDFRHDRLHLRQEAYRGLVADTYRRAKQEYERAEQTCKCNAGLLKDGIDAASRNDPNACHNRSLTEAVRYDNAMVEQWRKASATANELKSRYVMLFPKDIIEWYPARSDALID